MDAEWTKILTEIEDHLFPRLKLSSWEKVLYYHLLCHTRVAGSSSSSFSIAGLAASTSMSEATVWDAIRSINEKGCIIVRERSNRGHLTELRLPSEIPDIVVLPAQNVVVDIDKIDFFSDRRFLDALLEREGYRCFYSLREETKENCALDHVVPAVKGGDNSYRNIVVSSHEINALKQDQDAEDFTRLLFRKGMLSHSDLEDRIEALQLLKTGQLAPKSS
jgi:hypothetical protein